jgi:hypothetical protein
VGDEPEREHLATDTCVGDVYLSEQQVVEGVLEEEEQAGPV